MLTLETAQTLRGIAGAATRINYVVHGFEVDGAGVEVYKVLAQGQLPSSAGTLYTAPSGKVGMVKSIDLHNSGASTTVQLFIGGTAGVNAITASFTLSTSNSAHYEDGGWTIINGAGMKMEESV